MIRTPAVSGQFYAADPKRLRHDLESLIPEGRIPEPAIGVVAPHAGYVYSGRSAGELYASVTIPRTVLILGPNHHGVGSPAALFPSGAWETPLAPVPVESRLASLLARHAPLLREDTIAHQFEHSLEVQVPFLQHFRHDLSIVPICVGFRDLASCRALGEGIARAVTEFAEPVLIVASSDMSHYEPAEHARARDTAAIDRILALDPAGLLTLCREQGITMCGVVPATVMLIAALALGATAARLVSYTNSGDTSGDYRQVVGYASIAVS